MRLERGKDRAEAVGDRVERKRGKGRRGEGRNVSLGFLKLWGDISVGGREGKEGL